MLRTQTCPEHCLLTKMVVILSVCLVSVCLVSVCLLSVCAGIRMQLFRAIVFVIGCLLYVAEATYYDYWGEKIDISTYNTTVQRE